MRIKLFFLTIWSLWDPVYYFFTRLCYINRQSSNIFRVRLTRYKGREVELSDGTRITTNDVLVKLHLHNVILLRETFGMSPVQRTRFIKRKVERSLPELVEYLRKQSRYAEIKGIIGITFLNKGVHRLGFETVSIANGFYKWYKYITLLPIYMLFSVCPSIREWSQHKPMYLFMSKETLEQKYSVRFPINYR